MSRDPWKAKGKAARAARLGNAPIDPRYSVQLRSLAEIIDDLLNGKKKPKASGFVLMVFPMGHQGRCNYISNAAREDIKVLLREQLAYWDGQPEPTEGRMQ